MSERRGLAPAYVWAQRGIMEPIIFGSKGGFVDQHAQPVLSLLVPICNVERYLRQCLDSAAAQTLENIEIICINDGSTDSSSAWAGWASILSPAECAAENRTSLDEWRETVHCAAVSRLFLF